MATKWKIDPTHSEIQFKVKHLMISTVTGRFKTFGLEMETETEDVQNPTDIVFTADIDSITTNNDQRDAHLKSSDFFHKDEHPQLRFVGEKYQSRKDNAKLYGDLTIRGITKPIILDVEYGGTVVDMYGQTKAGFLVTGKISRKEFGLTWNMATETGGVIVSDEVKLHGEIQLIKQVAEETESIAA